MPYLEVLATFRDSVRKEARALKATPILKECDKIRDDVLPNLGVRYRITQLKMPYNGLRKRRWNCWKELRILVFPDEGL